MVTTFSRTGTARCRKSDFPESNGTVSFKEMTISWRADSMKISFSKPISSTKRRISSRKTFHSSEIRLFWFGASDVVGSSAVSELATGDCCIVISFLSMTYQATKNPRSNMVKPLRVIIHQFAPSFDEKTPVRALVGLRSIRDNDLSWLARRLERSGNIGLALHRQNNTRPILFSPYIGINVRTKQTVNLLAMAVAVGDQPLGSMFDGCSRKQKHH